MIYIGSKIFTSTIRPRKVFYFVNKKLNSILPHYHIVILVEPNEMVWVLCCTTQIEKRKRFLDSTKISYSTLVRIIPDEDNGLEKESYVDCNRIFNIDKVELSEKFSSGTLKYTGDISEDIFQQILYGLKESPMIEEIIKQKL